MAITAFAQSSFAPANAPDTNPIGAVPCRAASDLPANPRTGFQGTSYVDVPFGAGRQICDLPRANCGHSPFGDCQDARTVSGATEPFDIQGNRRFHFNGPDIKVASSAVIALAMTLNELCTNTTKFGALSTPAGSVEVAWTIDEEKQRTCLTWTERGGPLVQPSNATQLRTRMMESLGQQLNGEVKLSYHPSGFIYSLDVPLRSVIAA